MTTITIRIEHLIQTEAFKRRHSESPAEKWYFSDWEACIREAHDELGLDKG